MANNIIKKEFVDFRIKRVRMETGDSSGGTHHGGSSAMFSGRVKNKLACELDDIIFGQSLGEGKENEP